MPARSAPGEGQPAGLGAGCEDGGVVLDASPPASTTRRAWRRGASPWSVTTLDVVVGVEALGVDAGAVDVGLAPQHRLGQRRALVGRGRLVADEHDPPVETRLAGRLGRLRASEAGTEDHDGRLVVMANLLWSGGWGRGGDRGGGHWDVDTPVGGRWKAVAKRASASAASSSPKSRSATS